MAPGRWARFEMRVLCFEPNSSEFNRHVPNSPAGSERDLESAQWAGWGGRATPRVCQRHTATRVSSRDVGRVSMSVGERLKGTIVSVRLVRSAHRHHLLTRTERHQITRRTSDASLHGSGPLPEDAREVHTLSRKGHVSGTAATISSSGGDTRAQSSPARGTPFRCQKVKLTRLAAAREAIKSD